MHPALSDLAGSELGGVGLREAGWNAESNLSILPSFNLLLAPPIGTSPPEARGQGACSCSPCRSASWGTEQWGENGEGTQHSWDTRSGNYSYVQPEFWTIVAIQGNGLLTDQIIISVFKKWDCVLPLLPPALVFNLFLKDLKQFMHDPAMCTPIVKSIKATILHAGDLNYCR